MSSLENGWIIKKIKNYIVLQDHIEIFNVTD